MSWQDDPEFQKLLDAFIESLAEKWLRLDSLRDQLEDAFQRSSQGPLLEQIRLLAHGTAGAAENYGFTSLTHIAGAIDDLLGLAASSVDFEKMKAYAGIFGDALRIVVQEKKDPSGLLSSRAAQELISSAESLASESRS